MNSTILNIDAFSPIKATFIVYISEDNENVLMPDGTFFIANIPLCGVNYSSQRLELLSLMMDGTREGWWPNFCGGKRPDVCSQCMTIFPNDTPLFRPSCAPSIRFLWRRVRSSHAFHPQDYWCTRRNSGKIPASPQLPWPQSEIRPGNVEERRRQVPGNLETREAETIAECRWCFWVETWSGSHDDVDFWTSCFHAGVGISQFSKISDFRGIEIP